MRKHVGEILVERGLLTPQQLQAALALQRQESISLGQALCRHSGLQEEKLLEALAAELGVPYVRLEELPLPAETAKVIPAALAERYGVLPVAYKEGKLVLAMADPTNFFAIDDVRMTTGMEVEPLIASEEELASFIGRLYGRGEMVDKAMSRVQEQAPPAAELQTAAEAPVIQLVNSLIRQALHEHASDIHIEPTDKQVRVRYRIDGLLREAECFPLHLQAAILSRLKIIGALDIAEKRLPQDGRMLLQAEGRTVDIRISTLPVVGGEKAVLRLLDRATVRRELASLGMSVANLARYRQLYEGAYGMVLVTGPTGSGKTTTLYATLAALSSRSNNVVTVEDPVEYRLDGVNQVQVNYKTGLTFARALRSILRQDPDVVMVGEIRDAETADIAIRAAMTGQMVLSTLHTNDAAGAIARLADMGVPPFLTASAVRGVVAQRLVRLVCGECRETYVPAVASPEALLFGREQGPFYRGRGCRHCGYTGYRGRMAVQEVMPLSQRLRQLVHEKAPLDRLREAAQAEGMRTMAEDGLEKAKAGLTTLAELRRVTYGSGTAESTHHEVAD